MSDDTFQIQTGLDGVAQLDLAELADALQTVPTESRWKESDATRPKVAAPTKGPHRYTIYVPHDEGARINVGQGHPRWSEPGVSIDTKTHIHMCTFGGVPTYLSLGAAAGTTGFTTNQNTAGYALHTLGASNHWASGQVTIGSLSDGVILAGTNSVLIDSMTKTTTINGKESVNMSSDGNVVVSAGTDKEVNRSFWNEAQAGVILAGEIADLAAPGVSALGGSKKGDQVKAKAKTVNLVASCADEDAKDLARYVIVKSSGVIDKVATHLEAMAALVLGFKKAKKKCKEAKSGFEKEPVVVKFIFEVVDEVKAIVKDLSGAKESSSGEVKITAKKNVTITADDSVVIGAVKSAALSGFKAASVSSFSTSIKGHNKASVWGGFGASLKALAGEVEIGSDLKKVSIKGKKEVAIVSEDDKANLTAKENVQINSVDKKVFVHGKNGIYVGTGGGEGFGLLANPSSLKVGFLQTCDDFVEVKESKDQAYLRCLKKVIEVQANNESWIKVSSNLVHTKSKEVKIIAETGNVTIQGKKVNIN